MYNHEQRKQLAEILAKRLREDEANYITPQHNPETPDYWKDSLRNALEQWITYFNDTI